MAHVAALVERLAPDTIAQLERAAQRRFDDARMLSTKKEHRLTALYLYGYTAEMVLVAAYFRSVGFAPTHPIDRDARERRMSQARALHESGLPLMTSDPHPIPGWAKFLEWQRHLSAVTPKLSQRLREAVRQAELMYRHWRPALRYKTKDVTTGQLDEVRQAAEWFLENQGRF